MIFVMICKDRPGQLETRLANRPDHVAHLETLSARGILRFAGPLLDDEGNPCGSLVAIEAPDRAQAQAIADSDPYARAGLFESVDIAPWRWLFNNPEGT